MDLREALAAVVREVQPVPGADAAGPDRKNYTEKLSNRFTSVTAAYLRELGLPAKDPAGTRDKQFMGGYAPKGVDVDVSDEKHGLLLSSGTKGLPFSVAKNLKNRYRDIAMEALELHKRFPYAVCGHFFFLGRNECLRGINRRGAAGVVETNTLAQVVLLMEAISGRERPEDAPERYEGLGVMLFEPGDPDSLDLSPDGVPEPLWASTYCERLADLFVRRNPFYDDH